jgi:hypothetical protein
VDWVTAKRLAWHISITGSGRADVLPNPVYVGYFCVYEPMANRWTYTLQGYLSRFN